MNSVLKEFGLDTKKPKHSLLSQLYKIPKKDKKVNMPKFVYPKAGLVCQSDLLFMPTDKGFKYILVVVDNGSRLIDAEPLKTKESKGVVEAFKTIFARGVVNKPSVKIEVDSGSEFKAGVAKYFKDNGIIVRVAEVGRHRMQALVERANQTIGSILHKRMTAQELLTGTTSREWVKDLPKLVKALNTYITKREAKRKKKEPTIKEQLDADPVCSDGSCELLNIGDRVRVALEFPIDPVSRAKLHGKFRSSDIRFDPEPRIIKEVLLTPAQPPMYLLEGNVGDRKIHPVAYTKNQLQLIEKNEQAPKHEVVRGKPKQYIVEKLLERKKIKNKIYFLVKWKYYTDPKDQTYEPRSTLIKEVPNLVADFEKSH